MFSRAVLLVFTILLAICQIVKAQLGPIIISPTQNQTVSAGGKLDIVYQYQNVGTGNYSVDIQLWQDAAVTVPISNITTNHQIQSGNSSGVQISFTLNDTYTWNVQHGLNETFWLTVIETAQTPYYTKGLSLRSRPVMLHTSAANLMSKPASIAILFALSLVTLVMFS
jgi:hypothetical protein